MSLVTIHVYRIQCLSFFSIKQPYHRASQDVLGNRQATIAFADQALSQGENVVVDRTNVDAQ